VHGEKGSDKNLLQSKQLKKKKSLQTTHSFEITEVAFFTGTMHFQIHNQ